MGNLLVLTGRRYNLLETGTVTVTSENALYPKSRLYDGRPIQPFKFATAANESLAVDGNCVVNGNLDSWSAGLPVGWSLSAGTITEETVAVRSGSAVRLNGNSSGIRQDFVRRSGERVMLNGWRRILGAGQGIFQGYLQNLTTGRFWNGSTWVGGSGTVFLQDSTNTAYTQHGPSAITVEPFSVTKIDTCTLRLTLQNVDTTATDYVYVDDWFLWPSVDFCSIHGHNIPAGTTVTLLRGDAFPFDTEATFTVDRPSFYTYLAAVRDERHWGILFQGDTAEPIYLGEVVISRATALTRLPDLGSPVLAETSEAIVAMSEYGERLAVQRMTANRRRLGLDFRFSSEDDYTEARDELNRRAGGVPSVWPVVMVPDTDRGEVLHGSLVGGEWGVRRLTDDYFSDNTVAIEENAFPLLTS